MFTGIVEELGRVVAVERGAQSARLTVEGPRVERLRAETARPTVAVLAAEVSS